VKTLFVVGGNPIYNAPAELDWTALQQKVQNVIRVGYYEDETSRFANWHVPLAHYLESWGDARAADGSYTSVQPMIMPLFGGWSEIDLLAVVAGRPKPQGPELIQETFREVATPTDFLAGWAKFLHDGFLAKSAPQPAALTFSGASAITFAKENYSAPAADENSFEVVLVADTKVDDGRYANNGWLQELPDPITKLTWDNAAQISPASAGKLGLRVATSSRFPPMAARLKSRCSSRQVMRINPSAFRLVTGVISTVAWAGRGSVSMRIRCAPPLSRS
jgi:molybdopterin-containing oxidoreductase family iron-sulfur binding subunit